MLSRMVSAAVAERRAFWRRGRLPYNIALLVSGVLAGVAFAGVLIAWEIWPPGPEEFEHADFSLLSLVLAPFAYALAIAAANVLYLLGPLAEIVVRPREAQRFRRWIFGLGLAFSVLLPWAIPVNAWLEFLCVTFHS